MFLHWVYYIHAQMSKSQALLHHWPQVIYDTKNEYQGDHIFQISGHISWSSQFSIVKSGKLRFLCLTYFQNICMQKRMIEKCEKNTTKLKVTLSPVKTSPTGDQRYLISSIQSNFLQFSSIITPCQAHTIESNVTQMQANVECIFSPYLVVS